MKKAFDQTVRDIRREVNKKVLKVPGIEQKVLDATSNEPWGPHGSLLADIAQATRNYHEYQMIMTVIWKRINDTGKNWRHVYKGLTVLEYLVAHGSERVIDEIREHAYQISTLSDFQYIDSSGRDQGSNVRKKSQSLVILVNDKERIQEARQKAAANRDKFRNTSMGGMYRPGSYSSSGGYGDRYDDDHYEGRYGSRDDDRDGYGREREWGGRDDDRYGRHGDSYSRDRDRYGRDSDESYGRDGYRDDDYSGRSRNIDDYHYGSRSRSSDRERDRAIEDDGQYSSRGSGARADDHSQDTRGSGARADDQFQEGSLPGKRLDQKLSEQSLGVPPSYEDAVGEARSPVDSGRNRETAAVSVPQGSIPNMTVSPSQATSTPGMPAAPSPAASVNKEVDGFDEFDPRGSFSAAQATSNAAEVDLLGSLSESFSSSPLAIVPITAPTTSSGDDTSANVNSGPTFAVAQSASTVTSQPFEDPFGDGPFRAFPSTDGVLGPPQNIAPTTSFHSSANQSSELPQSVPGMAYTQSSNLDPQLSNANVQFSPQEPLTSNQDTDILAGILPPAAPSSHLTLQTGFPVQASQPTSMTGFSTPAGQPATVTDFPAQASQPAPQTGFPLQASNPTTQPVFPVQTGQHQLPAGFPAQVLQPTLQPGFVHQTAQPASLTSFPAQTEQSVTDFPGQFTSASQTGFPAPSSQPAQPNGNFYGNFLQQGSTAPNVASQTTSGPTPQYNPTDFLQQSSPAGGLPGQHNNNLLSNVLPQTQSTATMTTQSALTPSAGSLAIIPQPAKDKFEPKSAVWADTLSRGLVNLNISGSKINPLADIGIDFDAINRKEKRMEKPTTSAVTSTITMGKAMGSGSGIGRAGAGVLRATPNPTLGGTGMGGGGPVMGMGGYGGGMNQPPMGVGMGMNVPMNMGMGMGMNMGMGQGAQMQPAGFPPGSNVPGGYNPMIGRGGYPPQQPYGSGYR